MTRWCLDTLETSYGMCGILFEGQTLCGLGFGHYRSCYALFENYRSRQDF